MNTKHGVEVDEITYRPKEQISAEDENTPADERPIFSAEALAPSTRVVLLVLTLIASALAILTVAMGIVFSDGMLHLGTLGALFLGPLVMLIGLLELSFGALLENNRALGAAAHRVWFASFVLTGPVAFLLYWHLHVWPARRRT